MKCFSCRSLETLQKENSETTAASILPEKLQRRGDAVTEDNAQDAHVEGHGREDREHGGVRVGQGHQDASGGELDEEAQAHQGVGRVAAHQLDVQTGQGDHDGDVGAEKQGKEALRRAEVLHVDETRFLDKDEHPRKAEGDAQDVAACLCMGEDVAVGGEDLGFRRRPRLGEFEKEQQPDQCGVQ